MSGNFFIDAFLMSFLVGEEICEVSSLMITTIFIASGMEATVLFQVFHFKSSQLFFFLLFNHGQKVISLLSLNLIQILKVSQSSFFWVCNF